MAISTIIISFIVLQSYQSKAQANDSIKLDHSYMFNRAPAWLSKASVNDIKVVVFHSGFKRFSVTRNDSIEVLYDSDNDFEKNLLTIDKIYSAIKWFFSKYPVSSIANKPELDFWDLNYFERDEIYQKGPVFVFRDNQLTHIWLDIPKE